MPEIPIYMQRALDAYISRGEVPGDFLRAVLENNFVQAVGRADAENRAALPAYAAFLYNFAPSDAWGSPDNVAKWSARGGLSGSIS